MFNITDSFVFIDKWLSFFDLVVVDACKPRFFGSGTPTKKLDIPESGTTPVYSGGDHDTVTKMLGAEGPDIIYAGDHLYADVIKCRKQCEWRTLLVVPELSYECEVSQRNSGLLSQLNKFESVLADKPDLEELRIRLLDAVRQLNGDFGESGSLFRSGSRLSYFGSQVQVWSDLYTSSVNNLMGYDLNQRFVTAASKLPHEGELEDDISEM